ncbi:transient receptor potential cation channel subfamily V member 6-like [Lineus longissimus]|uniref:transient receptor potential cation channel subfamily V member 6-like n=1 Tax=Lineus longissimus TaxID=88925 RepID=UPI002B4D71C8
MREKGKKSKSKKSDHLLMKSSPTAKCPPEESEFKPEEFICFYDEECDKLLTELNAIPPEDEDFVIVTRPPRVHGVHDSPHTASSRGAGSFRSRGGSNRELAQAVRENIQIGLQTPKRSPAFARLQRLTAAPAGSESDPDYDNIEDGEEETQTEKSFDGSYSVIKRKPKKQDTPPKSQMKLPGVDKHTYSAVAKTDSAGKPEPVPPKNAEANSLRHEWPNTSREGSDNGRFQNGVEPDYQDLNINSANADVKKHTYANVNVSSELTGDMLHHDDSGISPGGVTIRSDNRSISWSNIRLHTSAEAYRRTGLNQSLSKITRNQMADAMTAPIEIDEMDALLERNEKHVSTLKQMLRAGKMKEFRKALFRAVKNNLRNTVSHMVSSLKDEGLDLCDDRFREPRFSATVLHAAILYKRDRIAIDLMTAFPKLVILEYTSKDFNNQTCFHLATANGNTSILRNMIHLIESPQERANILNTVADGTYFVKKKPEAATCLSAAAWTGQFDLIDILVKEGAELDLQGPEGNTLLHFIVHMSVKQADPSVYQGLVEYVYYISAGWWSLSKRAGILSPASDAEAEEMKVEAFRYLLRLKNSSGLSPVAMAAKLCSPLAPFLLSFEPVNKLPQTKFGAVSWSTYDVTDVVSYHPGVKVGRYDPQSVLHIMAHTGHIGNDSSDLTVTEPIRTVIAMKWSVYRFVYLLWSLAHIAHMLGLTFAAVHLHENSMKATNPSAATSIGNDTVTNSSSNTNEVRNIPMESFVLLLFLPILYIIFEFIDIIYTLYVSFDHLHTNKSLLAGRFPNLFVYAWDQRTITGNGPYRFIAFSHAVAVISWFGLACTDHQDKQIALSLSLIFGWTFVVFFTRVLEDIGRVSIMIQKMFFNDFAFFFGIFTIFLVAFSAGFFVVLPPGHTFSSTIESMISVMINTGAVVDTDLPGYHIYATVVVSVYGAFTTILLINLLIAAMNTSYEIVKNSKKHIGISQRLSILLMLERRFFWFTWLCNRSQNLVWFAEGSKMRLKLGIYSNPKRILIDVTEDLELERRKTAETNH